MDSNLNSVIYIIAGFFVVFLILAKPYFGLIITIASQPIIDLLPRIPVLSSVMPLIGALTVASFLLNYKNLNLRSAFHISFSHIFSLLFILWIFITNPTAAWLGVDRNWLLTYVQLWVLFWLSGVLFDKPGKFHTMMWVFSSLTLVTALSAMSRQGFFGEIDPLVRAAGFTDGANTAARYFVISFVFFSYLRPVTGNLLLNALAALGMIITFLGVFYTASRTGMILLLLAITLLMLLQSNFKYRMQVSVLAMVGFLILLIFSSSIFTFMSGIAPSITEGSDTMGLRYALWEAGWEMWKDNPISGVGIGMFPSTLKYYPNPEYSFLFYKGLVAHNIYVSMLAETGIFGFFLFMLFLLSNLVNFVRSIDRLDASFRPIAYAFFIVVIVMLAGGMTKTDQVDKVLWLSMGTSVFFSNQIKTSISKTKKKPEDSAETVEQSLAQIKPYGR